MVRSVFIRRTPSEKTTAAATLQRYQREIAPTKTATTKGARNRKPSRYFGEPPSPQLPVSLWLRSGMPRQGLGKKPDPFRMAR
jgi:hypothetical protein